MSEGRTEGAHACRGGRRRSWPRPGRCRLCAPREGSVRQSPIRLAAIRITGEGWEVLEGRAHGGWPIIAVRKAIILKSGAILGGLDRRWRRRGGKARCGWEKAGSCRCFGELPRCLPRGQFDITGMVASCFFWLFWQNLLGWMWKRFKRKEKRGGTPHTPLFFFSPAAGWGFWLRFRECVWL